MSNFKYPPYKQLQQVDAFILSGSVIIGGYDVKVKTAEVMEHEGFPIPEDKLEDFIVASFQDAITTMVKHGKEISTEAIEMVERIHDRKWTGVTTWVTDYVELLLGKCIKNHPYGVWDIFFRSGDLFIVCQGDYAHMLYEYLKEKGELPDFADVYTHRLHERV